MGRSGGQGFLDFVQVGTFDDDHHVLRRLLDRDGGRLADAAGHLGMVLLDEDRVVQPEAVVVAAAGEHGLLLELAQQRGGLARVQDPRAAAVDGLDVAAGQRRGTPQPPPEGEGKAVPPQERPKLTPRTPPRESGAHPFPPKASTDPPPRQRRRVPPPATPLRWLAP